MNKKKLMLLLILSLIVNMFAIGNSFAEEISSDKFIPGELLVSIYSDSSENIELFSTDNSVFSEIDVNKVETLMEYDTNDYTESFNPSITIVKVTLNTQNEEDVFDAMEELSNNPTVSAVQPNYIVDVEETIPNDEFYDDLWGMDDVAVYDAWDKFTGNGSVVVGIIDTGIDFTHPDLIDNIWNNPNAADGVDTHGWNFAQNNNDIMDYHGHGTHVAGIIGASGNNLIGVSGVNWNVSLASLKVYNGKNAQGVSAIISAVDYAIDNNINILNCSLGWETKDNNNGVLKDAIGRYEGLFVCSAGNEEQDNDQPGNTHYPSEFSKTLENVIAVGAIDELNECKFGYGTESIQLGAPGVNIWSTASQESNGATYKYGSDDSKYELRSGTSMAAPFVTGAAALLMGYKPDLTPIEVKDIILQNVEEKPQLEDKFTTGGKLSIKNIFDAVGSGNISSSINNVSYNGSFEIESINLVADGIYINNDVYITVNRYNVSDDLLYSITDTLHIDGSGVGSYTNLNQDIQLRSSSEHLDILVYEDNEYNKLVSKQSVYPVLFTF